MRLSLVIPTRERAEVLEPCLRRALASDDPHLELIVSDNCSQDETPEVLARYDDPRLQIVRPQTRVSMRRNFEHALDATTGDYVIFIGDDDGVSLHGLSLLRQVLEAEAPDAVGWNLPSYAWPDPSDPSAKGYLSIKYKDVFGPAVTRDPKRTVEKLRKGTLRNYREAANIYHGCVSRRLIDAVRGQANGEYFGGLTPDVFASVANLYCIRGAWLWMEQAVTFGGVSNRSNGAAHTFGADKRHSFASEKKRFMVESLEDGGRNLMDPAIPSLAAATLDMLVTVSARLGLNECGIDFASWYERILKQLRALPPSAHADAMLAVESFAARSGSTDALRSLEGRYPAVGAEQADASVAPSPMRASVRAGRVEVLAYQGLADVEDAGKLLDRFVQSADNLPGRRYSAARVLRWARLLGHAKRFQADH